ncbi:hypothetical protein EV645_3679 [Kribbella rubisoli]|uniref:DUF4440 domain-containing protein n=1 Tax=Kribbella rubisoli TaxID=3075929 RepID=A0A4Q7X005_9ACTN|nr:hypothetical protein [Kribbella rubisoli]RZU16131.1 hypothetical protein EV645_3679 [Kribbella rubisoli]
MKVRDDVAEFFDRFATTSDGAGFHPTLLTLDPVSVTPVTREQVVASLPRRKEFFAGLGITGMTLDSLDESPVDDQHTLVRSTWRLERTPSSSVPEGTIFTSTYLLRKVDGEWQIVVYLNHQDLRTLISA